MRHSIAGSGVLERVEDGRRFGILRVGLIFPSLIVIPWLPLFRLAASNDEYTHIVLVPFIAMALIYMDRSHIFSEIRYCKFAVIPMALTALLLFGQRKGQLFSPAEDIKFSLDTLLGLGILLAAFTLCFGVRTFQRALFPLLFLLLSVPVPKSMMGAIIRLLQEASAAFSTILFKLIRLPTFRQGLLFSLPGFNLEIAEQCSGIRSSIVLSIVSMLAGHLFLKAFWRKLFLVLLTIPVVILKNAVRIVTLATLAVYVNHDFLYGNLHHYGGILFSLFEFAIVTPVVMRWHKLERRTLQPTQKGTSEQASA